MRIGLNRVTGQTLIGWQHVVQSIWVILTTRVGSRVMRRSFGSSVPLLQDANATRQVLLEFYVAAAEALLAEEPDFRLRTFELEQGGRDGVFVIILTGDYYPRGYLGDYSARETQSTRVEARLNDNGFAVVGLAA